MVFGMKFMIYLNSSLRIILSTRMRVKIMNLQQQCDL